MADVDGVVADAKTLTDILDDLLTAADTRSQAERTTVDLGALVEGVGAATQAAAERSGVTLTVVNVPAQPAVVEGSPPSLRRAVTALVDNAVSHARSAVTISVLASERRVEIVVSDDGPGIPKDVAPRLFDRFASGRTETAAPEGRRHYGLGLALVADVAANHDGRVAVADRGDGERGAVFTLSLPTSRRAR